jgi:hypothetical protein
MTKSPRALRIASVVGAFFLLAIDPSLAHLAAKAEEVLCSQDDAFSGTVLKARSHDCRLTETTCASFYAGVSIRVDEVLSPSSGMFHRGDEVQVAFHVRNGTPMVVGDLTGHLTIPMNSTGGGGIGFPATGRAITDAEAEAQLVGKHLTLAVTPVGSLHTSLGPAADAKMIADIGEPYFAEAYTSSEEAWVRSMWSSPQCAQWKRQ